MAQKSDFGWCRLILYVLSALLAFWIANKFSPITDGIVDAVIAALLFIGLMLLFFWVSRKICGMLGGANSSTSTLGATGAATAATAVGAKGAATDGAHSAASTTSQAKDAAVEAVTGRDDTAVDVDGDGVADTLDVDGDGVADLDLSEGKVDIVADSSVGSEVDLDGDGAVDGVAVDSDGDGVVDGVDLDGDGQADVGAQSASGDRITDTKHASEMTDEERAQARAAAGLLNEAREGGPDDLKKIKGVGPKFESLMHEIGVFHFDQVANWTAADIQFVDDHLTAFKGRIVRDDWVGQAKILASGGETSFSNKVDKGGVY